MGGTGEGEFVKNVDSQSPISPDSESLCLGPELCILTIPQSDSAAGDPLRNRSFARWFPSLQIRPKSVLHPIPPTGLFTISPSGSKAGSRGSSFYPLAS